MSNADRESQPSLGGASDGSGDPVEAGDVGDGDSLDTFKAALEGADIHGVDESNHGRARWNWHPVTDAGGTGRAGQRGSGFQFDLGGALARLGDHHDDDAPADDRDNHHRDHSGGVGPEDGPDVQPAPPVARAGPDVQPSAPVARDGPDVQPAPPVARDVGRPGAAPPDVAPTLDVSGPDHPDPDIDLDPLPPLERRERRRAVAEDPLPPLERRERASSSPGGESTADLRRRTDDADPVPVIQEATPVDTTPSRHSMISRRSVFEERSNPTLPGVGSVPTMPMSHAQPGAAAPSQPSLPSAAGAGAAMLPTLPKANPAAPPPVSTPIETAPSTPDVHALRSAQLRASQQQRTGKLFGRTFLAFVVVGGLIAAAMLFGRSYLFPTEWDPALTPLVDEIQQAQGSEFDHTIPLVVQTPDEYALTVLAATLGTEWSARLPEWRALGLVGPDTTAESVGAVIAARYPAHYDLATDTIYRSEADATPTEHLRLALAEAFLRQATSGEAAAEDAAEAADDAADEPFRGLTGLAPAEEIGRRAIDRFVIARTAGPFEPEADAVEQAADAEPAPAVIVPVPIAYHLGAIDVLGEAILVGSNVDPSSVPFGVYPVETDGALDDLPMSTSGALLRPGEQALGDAVALGDDDWSLVWGRSLAGASVDRMADAVTADSYRAIDRGGVTCFVAVFQTASDTDGTFVLTSLLRWASERPAAAQAVATSLSPTRVQLEACDPGPESAAAPDLAVVDALLNRQIDRLAS